MTAAVAAFPSDYWWNCERDRGLEMQSEAEAKVGNCWNYRSC